MRFGGVGTPLYCCGKVQQWKIVWKFLKILNIELPYSPAFQIYIHKNGIHNRIKVLSVIQLYMKKGKNHKFCQITHFKTVFKNSSKLVLHLYLFRIPKFSLRFWGRH